MKQARRSYALYFCLLCISYFFISCQNQTSGTSDSSTPSSNTTSIDPWNQNLGAAVTGVTLSNGWYGLSELPAPVNVTGGWTDSAACSTDGTSVYFGYSRWDSGEFADTYQDVETGPLRTGMSGDAFKMFRADLSSGGWTVNYLPFNGSASVPEASQSPNAAQNLVVFTRFSDSGQGTLYLTSLSNGSWSTPQAFPSSPLAINTSNLACLNDNGFIVGDINTGYTLYFESARADPTGITTRTYTGTGTSQGSHRRFWQVCWTPSQGYYNLEEVPGLDGDPSTSTNEDDVQISLTPDQLTVYFTRVDYSSVYGICTATRSSTSSAFGTVQVIAQPTFATPYTGNAIAIGEANPATTSEGTLLYLICGIAGSDTTAAKSPAYKVCVMRKKAQ